MNLCLDTCVIIDLIRGDKPHYRRRLQTEAARGVTFHLSTIVMHELEVGVLLNPDSDGERNRVRRFCDGMAREDWDAEDALEAARIRVELRRAGQKIDAPDVLLAGQVRRRGWTLITSNLKHFTRVGGLNCTDWTADA